MSPPRGSPATGPASSGSSDAVPAAEPLSAAAGGSAAAPGEPGAGVGSVAKADLSAEAAL